MSTRAPRNGTSSAASRRRCRSPLASDPSARTIRCHGTPSSSHSARTAPAKRGAPGDTSPYVRTKPGGVSRIRARTRSRRLIAGYRRASCATARTRSSPSTPPPGSTARPCTPTGSRSARCASGRGPVSGRWPPNPWSSPPTGRTGSTAWPAAMTPPPRSRHCWVPDALAAVRQVGIVDAAGAVAVHTGEDCIPCAGDATGEHVSAQANMMARDTVPAAMVAGFEAAGGDLAGRLMAALDAAEGEGGDVRGRQSAAVVVVPPQGEAWQARFDLRVEDHADPVEEMRRLLRLARAYELAGEADELMASDRAAEAGPLYERAAELAPESDELLFWAGLAQAHAGDAERGLAAVRRAIEVNPGWRTLLERLSPDFAPAGERVRRELDSSPL